MSLYSLSYSNIHLEPKYSQLHSRSEADTSVSLFNRKFKLPVIPANMRCTIDKKLSHYLSENDYLYAMHRFDSIDERISFVVEACQANWKFISVSVGVTQSEKDFLTKLKHLMTDIRVDCFWIDVAHGHHILVKETISFIKDLFPNSFIVAGNISTNKAYKDLVDWGADAVKCGIGEGSSCSTYTHTGFVSPMFSTILNIDSCGNKPIIADGGIRCNGDIAKALVAGATAVMIGSEFAKCIDSPAPINKATIDTKYVQGKIFTKTYYGSASKNNGNNKNIEGKTIVLPCNQMTYKEKLQEIKEDLSSSISYAGGYSLEAFHSTSWKVHYKV